MMQSSYVVQLALQVTGKHGISESRTDRPRHVLGNQIFDYWFDESGFEMEHYADGDLVNCDTPVTCEESGPNTFYVWGPKVPEGR